MHNMLNNLQMIPLIFHHTNPTCTILRKQESVCTSWSNFNLLASVATEHAYTCDRCARHGRERQYSMHILTKCVRVDIHIHSILEKSMPHATCAQRTARSFIPIICQNLHYTTNPQTPSLGSVFGHKHLLRPILSASTNPLRQLNTHSDACRRHKTWLAHARVRDVTAPITIALVYYYSTMVYVVFCLPSHGRLLG